MHREHDVCGAVRARRTSPAHVVRNERALASDTARFGESTFRCNDLSHLSCETELTERNGVVRQRLVEATTTSTRAQPGRSVAGSIVLMPPTADTYTSFSRIFELRVPIEHRDDQRAAASDRHRSPCAAASVRCSSRRAPGSRRRTDAVRRRTRRGSIRAAPVQRSASRYALASRIGNSPSDVMSKNPTSCVEPNRFFSARRMRTPDERSPSNDRTTSTRCSSTRGPATMPSFVTCPTRTTVTPLSRAARTRRAPHSRTWDTEPGADGISGSKIVWIESIDHDRRARLARSRRGPPAAAGRPASARLRGSARAARRGPSPARGASSPHTSRTSVVAPSASAVCSVSVDFPTPGSPASRTTLARTIPPPRTRSISSIPVGVRSAPAGSWTASGSVAGAALATDAATCRRDALLDDRPELAALRAAADPPRHLGAAGLARGDRLRPAHRCLRFATTWQECRDRRRQGTPFGRLAPRRDRKDQPHMKTKVTAACLVLFLAAACGSRGGRDDGANASPRTQSALRTLRRSTRRSPRT